MEIGEDLESGGKSGTARWQLLKCTTHRALISAFEIFADAYYTHSVNVQQIECKGSQLFQLLAKTGFSRGRVL